MIPKETINLLRQIAVVIAVIATIVVGILANALPFNGLTTGQISAQFDILFEPAPYAFSIWILIYVGLAAYAIYQAQPSLRDDQRLRSLDVPFLIGSLANIAWLFVWHFQHVVASFIVMLVLLGSLIAVRRRLMPERALAPTLRRWVVHYVFAVYLGWVMVASVANLAVLTDYTGFEGLGLSDLGWFTIGSLALLVVAALITFRQRDVPLLLTLIWAFVGLGVALLMVPVAATVAWVVTAGLIVLLAIGAVRRMTAGQLDAGMAGMAGMEASEKMSMEAGDEPRCHGEPL